jgi:hypothetical protein
VFFWGWGTESLPRVLTTQLDLGREPLLSVTSTKMEIRISQSPTEAQTSMCFLETERVDFPREINTQPWVIPFQSRLPILMGTVY